MTGSFEKTITGRQVAERLAVSASTIVRRRREDPDFPAPRQIGPNTTRWRETGVAAWLANRPIPAAYRFDDGDDDG